MPDLSSTGTRFSVIQPDLLPVMKVLEAVSTEKILSNRMAQLVSIWKGHDPPNGAQYDVGALEFDPIRINQECNTYFELLLRDRVNQACRSITLAFAVGSDLDAIASRYPGGVPRLPDEADNRYRRRVWLSVNPLSPHGTAESYQYWALTALDGILRDASAIKIRTALEENPVITVSCLSSNPTDPRPTNEQIIAIRSYILDQTRMAMTDVISVKAPKIKQTPYHLRVWLYPGPDKDSVMTNVRANIAALIEAQYWLGFDHTQMAIMAAGAVSGVSDIDILEPAEDIHIEVDWVVRVTEVIIEYAGRRE